MTNTATLDNPQLEQDAALVRDSIRIGQISYLNVFPMHWNLGVESTTLGAPTTLNAQLVAGDIDAACISSIEYARHADELVLLPSMCIATAGAVGSIFAFSAQPFDAVKTWHVTTASATSVALLENLARLRGATPNISPLEGGDQVESAAAAIAVGTPTGVLLIGDDAMAARRDPRFAALNCTDLGERWFAETGLPMTYAVWAVRRDVAQAQPEACAALDRLLVASVDAFSHRPEGVNQAAEKWNMDPHTVRAYFDRLCYGFGTDERKGLLRFFRMSNENGLLDAVPTPEFTSPGIETEYSPVGHSSTWATLTTEEVHARYAESVGSKAAVTQRDIDERDGQRALAMEADARTLDVDAILQQALNNERINTTQAVSLLQSDRLLDIGQVAHELRLRRTDPNVVTFVIDRNINYTNLCVTDCGFCAFYRRPGDSVEGYLHSTETILEKIHETIDLGGTAALMQGGHNPDCDIDYYVELFSAVKKRFPNFHMHALSPPEIQHIARRSKLTVAETLAALRDAGLDSLPGGGGEILVDRVRRIIAPKKTKGAEWIDIMREAQRIGMSTTASMMYGHVELLAERALHMEMIRELQDETNGFRAFISWTFQPGQTPLAMLMETGNAPFYDNFPITPTPVQYLLTQAVSRIFLDNIDNIQSSWVTQGMKVGQAALMYGANDMGSIMIEENVVSSAGTTFSATTEDFVHAINATGKIAVQRDTLYRTVQTHEL